MEKDCTFPAGNFCFDLLGIGGFHRGFGFYGVAGIPDREANLVSFISFPERGSLLDHFYDRRIFRHVFLRISWNA